MAQITERPLAERQQSLAARLAINTHAPWSGVDQATILAWVQNLDLVSTDCHYHLIPDARLWGMSVDQMREHATARAGRRNRRAGYTALKSQYGEDSAKRIISRGR